MSNQAKNSNLNYWIGPTFNKVNRSFISSFENEIDRNRLVIIKCLLLKYKIFNVPIKNKEKTYEKNIEMSRNNDYTTDNLLHSKYFSKNYRLMAIDISKEIELENVDTMQLINFIGRLERNEGGTMFFVIEKTEGTIFNFSQNAVSVI